MPRLSDDQKHTVLIYSVLSSLATILALLIIFGN